MAIKTQLKLSEYTLQPEEVEKILDKITNLRDRCIIGCLFYFGMRANEVCKFDVRDIDFERNVIHIRLSKGGKTRSIPIINQRLLSDIRLLILDRNAGPIFISRLGQPLTVRSIENITKKWGNYAKIEHPHPHKKYLNPHLFRHSCARALKDVGYSAEFIQKYLGHSSIKTTMDIYGTLSLNEMQQIVINKNQHNSKSNSIQPFY